MKTILVTGASGFIGSRLTKRLVKAGWNVLATALNPSVGLNAELGVSEVHNLDVLMPVSFTSHVPIDAIVHCATANDILSRDFNAGINLSVIGTRNILEFAVHNGIPRLLFFSTLQVYGTELEGRIDESTPVRPETPYALNHWLGEEVCRMYARNNKIDIALLRPSNVYGIPDVSTVERDTLVPMCFVRDAITAGRLSLRSSGLQRRNFVSTDEVADACLYLLDNYPAGCLPVNVGSGWHAKIIDIAEMVGSVYRDRTGMDLPIEVLSELPAGSNLFTLGSSLEPMYVAREDSRAFMYSIINGLFEYYQNKVRRIK